MLDIAGVNKGSCNLILNASFYGQVKLSAVISHRILNQANQSSRISLPNSPIAKP